MSNRSNAYTEVYTILEDLNEEEYNKIPPEIIETIKANRNEQYNYELDDEVELKEQPMLPETKAILFNLFRDYLATPEQKQKIIKMQNEERQKNEEKKKQNYCNINMFERELNEMYSNINSTEDLHPEIIKKENILKKLINLIKRCFRI